LASAILKILSVTPPNAITYFKSLSSDCERFKILKQPYSKFSDFWMQWAAVEEKLENLAKVLEIFESGERVEATVKRLFFLFF